jgi:hypothetical protein
MTSDSRLVDPLFKARSFCGIIPTKLLRGGSVMKKLLIAPISFVLGLVIEVLEPLAKKSKATWDDTVIKVMKLIKLALQLGGFKK